MHPSTIPKQLPTSCLDAQNSLAKVLALKDAHQPLGSAVDALGIRHLGLEAAVGKPLLQLLLMLLVVGRAELGVGDNEALHGDLLGHDQHQVADAVRLAGVVVLADLKRR